MSSEENLSFFHIGEEFFELFEEILGQSAWLSRLLHGDGGLFSSVAVISCLFSFHPGDYI